MKHCGLRIKCIDCKAKETCLFYISKRVSTCGNCKYFKTLKIIPFVKGFYVGDGRCLFPKHRLYKEYKTVGDSCENIEKAAGIKEGK
jgi:hypothetical protein